VAVLPISTEAVTAALAAAAGTIAAAIANEAPKIIVRKAGMRDPQSETDSSGDYRAMTEWQVDAHHRDETWTLGPSLDSSTHSGFIAAAVIFVTD
jgi:hypothetical protein